MNYTAYETGKHFASNLSQIRDNYLHTWLPAISTCVSQSVVSWHDPDSQVNGKPSFPRKEKSLKITSNLKVKCTFIISFKIQVLQNLLVIVCVTVESSAVSTNDILQFSVRQISTFRGGDHYKSILSRINPFHCSSTITEIRFNIQMDRLDLDINLQLTFCHLITETYFALDPIQ